MVQATWPCWPQSWLGRPVRSWADTNAAILETARARAYAAGHHNISFKAGDIVESVLEQDFDAVVGRYVLMFVPDPVAAVRAAGRRLRPGGIAAFQECDWTQSPYAAPPSPLLDQVWNWIADAFKNPVVTRRWGSSCGTYSSSRICRATAAWRQIARRWRGLGAATNISPA